MPSRHRWRGGSWIGSGQPVRRPQTFMNECPNVPYSAMPANEKLRSVFRSKLPETIGKINSALRGKDVNVLEPVLARIGRGQQLPHWYEGLRKTHTLPNLDGKTIGSVVEMLLVAILETHTFRGLKAPPLR